MKTRQYKLTHQRLKEVLDYDPETGVFKWKDCNHLPGKNGEIAGGDNGEGYTRIMVDGERISAHRLAWLYVYGQWPLICIDHINHNKSDNRTSNLRDVTLSENQRNRPTRYEKSENNSGAEKMPRMELNIVRIKRELARLGKNKSWLAKELKCSRQLVEYWFATRTIKAADKIGDVLRVNIRDLIVS